LKAFSGNAWTSSNSNTVAVTTNKVGSAPTITNVSAVNLTTNSLKVTFTGSADGIPATTKYQYYTTPPGVSGIADATGILDGSFVITGLSSGTAYGVTMRALSGTAWTSADSIKYNDVSTNTFGSKPSLSVANGTGKITVTYSQATAGTTGTTFFYSLNGGALTAAPSSPFDLSGASFTGTSPYSVYVLARNPAGDISSNTITGNVFGSQPTVSVANGTGKITVTYSQATTGTTGTTFFYSLNGGALTAAPASPFDLSGASFTGTSPYSVYVLARNPAGDISSNTITGNVFGSQPTVSVANGTGKITVTYSQATVGSGTTTFFYSLNGGALTAAPSSPFDLSGASFTGTSPYSVYVLARNPAGDISSNTITGNVFGSQPTVSVANGTGKITVTYSQATVGSGTTTFFYSLNGGALTAAPSSPFDLSGASFTGTSPYSVYVLARNPAGDISSNTITGNVFGSQPSLSVTNGTGKITVTYSQATAGTTGTTFFYSLNGGALTTAPASPFDLSGASFTGTSPYSVYVLARNPAGDISSNTITGNVFGSQPTLSVANGTGKITVTYSQATAGTTGTTFFYSLNGGALTAAPSSPFDLSGSALTNTSPYSVYVLARNPAGDISSNTATGNVFGSTPTGTATSGLNKLTIGFSQNTMGTSPTTYYYNFDGSSNNLTKGPVTSPFDISNISTTQTVYIVASNPAGNLISTGIVGTPYITGSAPSGFSVTPSTTLNRLNIAFNASTGGNPSTFIYYYLYLDASATPFKTGKYTDVSSSFITSVSSDLHTITVKTKAYISDASASNTANAIWTTADISGQATPYYTASSPKNMAIVPVQNTTNLARVTFTTPDVIGNPALTVYQYSLNNTAGFGDALNLQTDGSTNTFTINLSSGTFYTIYFRASRRGTVAWNGPYVTGTVTTNSIGNNPTFSYTSTQPNQISVSYSQSIIGTSPTSYYYYLNGVKSSLISTASNGTFIVQDLTNTTANYYSLYMLASNAGGDISSNAPQVINFLGSAPLIGTVTPGVNQLSVEFTQSAVGSLPTTYYYSADGTTKLGTGTTTSPLLITGISTTTTFYIIANNAAGDIRSVLSGSGTPYLIGLAPIIRTVTPGKNSLIVDFSGSIGGVPAPTTYLYSLDGGTYIDANTVVSPMTIGKLTQSKEYVVTIVAQNAGGITVASNSVAGTPIIDAGGVVTPATFWTQQYWTKTSYWKRQSFWSRRR
jgi:hypothetical protein